MNLTPPPKPWGALSWYEHADALLCAPDNAAGIASRVALLDEQGHSKYAAWLREHHGDEFSPAAIRAHGLAVSRFLGQVGE